MRKMNLYSVPAMFVMALIVLSACGSAATATPNLPAVILPTLAPVSTASQAPAAQNTAAGPASTSSGIQWPSAMPADVPIFTYGTITGSNNNVMGNVQGAYNNVPAEAFTKYQSDLKSAGWTISVANQSANGFEIDATKGVRTVVAMFINSKSTGLTGAVTYNGHGS
jgi:hypothetical protein